MPGGKLNSHQILKILNSERENLLAYTGDIGYTHEKTKNTLFYFNTPVFDYLVYKLVVKMLETFKFDSIAKMKSMNTFLFLC